MLYPYSIRSPTEKALLRRLANCGLSKHKKRGASRNNAAPYERNVDNLTAANTAHNRPNSARGKASLNASLNASRESLRNVTSDQGPGRRRNFDIVQPHTTEVINVDGSLSRA